MSETPTPRTQQHWAEAVAECVTDEQEALRLVRMYEEDEWPKAMLDIGRALLATRRALTVERDARKRAEAELKENEAVINVWRGRTQRAEAERDALAEALRPFAALLQSHHARRKDDQPIFELNDQTITAGDLRRARAALAALERGDGKEAGGG